MLTPEQIQKMNQITGLNKPVAPAQEVGKSRAEQIRALAPQPAQTTKNPFNPFPVAPRETVSPGQAISDQASGGVSQIKEALSGNPMERSVGDQLKRGLKIASGVATVASSPFAPVMRPVGEIINDVGQIGTDNPEYQKFAESPAGKTISDVAENVSDVANVAGTVGGFMAGGKAVPKVVKGAQEMGTKLDASMAESAKQSKSQALTQKTATQSKAVDSLESDYYKWMGQTKPGVKAIVKSGAKTEALNNAGTTGKTPQRVLAESGIIPKTEGTKFSTADQARSLRESTAHLNEALQSAAKEVDMATAPKSIRELQNEATQRVYNQRMPESDRLALLNGIRSEFKLLQERYGDSLSASQINELKSNYWKGTKFDSTKPFQGDAYYQVGKSLQKGFEDMASKAGFDDVAQLNREIGDKLEAAKYLESLNGNTLKYGKVGKYAFMMIGASLGHGLVGKVLGTLGGEAVGELLMRADIATPVKRRILNSIEQKSPEAYQETLKWLEAQGAERDTRLQLPAGGDTSAPIQLPSEGIMESQQKINQMRPTDLSMTKPMANANSVSPIADTVPQSSPKEQGGVPNTQGIEDSKYYHGGNLDKGIKPGLYVSPEKDAAGMYAAHVKGKTYEFSVPKDLKFISAKEYDAYRGELGSHEEAANHFASKGYDALKAGNGDLIVFKPELLKPADTSGGVDDYSIYENLGFPEESFKDLTPIKQDGKIVGGIEASLHRGDPQRLNIHHVRIIPDAQGKGLGTQAVSQLFKDNPDVNKLVGHATAESKSFWQKQPGVEFSGPDKNIFTITRSSPSILKDLESSTPSKTQAASLALYNKDPAGMVVAYRKLPTTNGGKISNTDLARPLFKEAGYNGTNAFDVQDPAKKIALKTWEENLMNNPEPYGIVNVGGSGVGKSSTLNVLDPKSMDTAAAVWDGNSDSLDSLKSKILQVVGAGKKAKVVYTFAPIETAFMRMISRMLNNKSEEGRVVLSSELVNNHAGSHEAISQALKDPEIAKLIEQGKVIPILRDNSGLTLQESGPLANLQDITYNKPALLATLRQKAKDLYDAGKISKDQYEAVIK